MQNRFSRSFVQNNFADILNQVYSYNKKIILTDKGIEIAAIIPVALMRLLWNKKAATKMKNASHSEKIKQIKQYKKGYQMFPENVDEINVWQQAAFENFSQGEGW